MNTENLEATPAPKSNRCRPVPAPKLNHDDSDLHRETSTPFTDPNRAVTVRERAKPEILRLNPCTNSDPYRPVSASQQSRDRKGAMPFVRPIMIAHARLLLFAIAHRFTQ